MRRTKRSIKWLAVTMLLMMLLTGMFPGLAAGGAEPPEVDDDVVVETNGGTITLTKTAEPTEGCRVFDVMLTVAGEQNDPAPVDVILVIDRSISMDGSPLQQTQNAAINLVKEILKDGDSGNRVGLVSYATKATLNLGLTNEKNDVINAINNLSASYSDSNQGYTNIAEGFRVAAENMAEDKPLEQRAIILLSDGAANRGPGTTSFPGTIWPTRHNYHTNGAVTAGVNAQHKAKVFTVGLFGEVPGNSLDVCVETLKNAQNGGYYDTRSIDIETSLTEIYSLIWQNITAVATGAIVTDTVASGFRIVENSASATPGTVSVDYDNNIIEWNIGDIGNITATLTYKVQAVGTNTGGADMTVNESAVLGYYELENENDVKSEYFPVPTVYVPLKLVVDAGENQTIYLGESVTLGGDPTASGGYSRYTYLWQKMLGEDSYEAVSEDANPTVSPRETTTYMVTVTDRLYFREVPACVKSKTVTVTVLEEPPVPETVTLTVYKRIEGDDGFNPDQKFAITVSEIIELAYSDVMAGFKLAQAGTQNGEISVNTPYTFELSPGRYTLVESTPLPSRYTFDHIEDEYGHEIENGEFFLEGDWVLYVVNRYSAPPPPPPPPPPPSSEVLLRVEKNIIDGNGQSLNNVSPHNTQTFEVSINGALYSFSVNNPVVLGGYEEGSTFTITENKSLPANYEYVEGDMEITIDSGTRTVTITNRYVEPTPPPPPPPSPPPTPEPPAPPIEEEEEIFPETPQVPDVEVTPEPPALPDEPEEVIEEVPELPKTSAFDASAIDLVYLGLGAAIMSVVAIRRRKK